MKDFLIDTHAHLFLEDFDDDIEDVLDRMIKKNRPNSWPALLLGSVLIIVSTHNPFSG